MGALLDTFPGQPLDFYGALRSATYDGQIRAWIRDEVVQGDISAEDANMKELTRRLINRCDCCARMHITCMTLRPSAAVDTLLLQLAILRPSCCSQLCRTQCCNMCCDDDNHRIFRALMVAVGH